MEILDKNTVFNNLLNKKSLNLKKKTGEENYVE